VDAGAGLERMLSRMWEAIAAGDPMRAEIEVAICMAVPRVGRLDPVKVTDFSAKVLVNEAIERWGADGTAMLRLLMALGSPPVKRSAGAALAEMTRIGIYPPEWVDQVGKAVPVRAMRRYDVFGDEEVIEVTFRYGEAEHGIAVQVELTGIPVATDIVVTLEPARLTEVLGRPGVPFESSEPIGLAQARRRLEGALARADLAPGRELSVETLAGLPIARSRVRRLPAGEPGEAPGQFTEADRAAAVDAFLASPLAAEAVAADREATRFWAEVLTGYSGRIPGEPPAQAGPHKLARILLEHVPGTVVVSPEQRRHLEPAVTAWARWSAEYRNLGEAAAAHLAAALPGVFAAFDEAYDDPAAVAARGHPVGSGAGDR
jgi:hypothetical protein